MASVRNRNETLIAYLFLAPFLIAFVVFLGYPIVYSLYLSFHETTVFTDWFNIFGDMRWTGFGNYSDLLFNDFEFWWSLYRTLIYALLMIPAQIVIGFFLAVLLREKLPGRDFFRGAYFMPHVLDVFVVGTIWVLIYSPNYGLLDVLLTRIGIDYFSSTGVLGNPWTALPAIAFALVLKSAGFGMILFLAAMSNIPESVYEAADIDGANFWQKHHHVTTTVDMLNAEPRLALNLAQPAACRDTLAWQARAEVDHIFPQSVWRPKVGDAVDDIGNFAWLGKLRNIRKTDEEPASYFKDVPDDELLDQYLVQRELLHPDRFAECIADRRERILGKVRAALGR